MELVDVLTSDKKSEILFILPVVSAVYLFYRNTINFELLILTSTVSAILMAFSSIAAYYLMNQKKVYQKEIKAKIITLPRSTLLMLGALFFIWGLIFLYLGYVAIKFDNYSRILLMINLYFLFEALSRLFFFERFKRWVKK